MAISIKRAGVINFSLGYETQLMVNQESMLSLLDAELENLNVPRDYNGAFAGYVEINVGFYPSDN